MIAPAAVAAGAWALHAAGASGAGRPPQDAGQAVRALRVEVVRELPHDRSAYTQGLLWWDGRLYESTGRYGESTLRRIDPATGAVEQRIDLSPAFFGEGLARSGRRLILLTWKAERALAYDLGTFEFVRAFRYRGEGWGLCHDGARFVMSDGSDVLTFRDPESFAPAGSVRVTLRGRPQDRLNELECVDGAVYANVWQEEYIVRIDPATGRVTHQIDAAGLLSRTEARGVDVLNGIAHDPDAGAFYLTGKWWPKMFEVRFAPPRASQSQETPSPVPAGWRVDGAMLSPHCFVYEGPSSDRFQAVAERFSLQDYDEFSRDTGRYFGEPIPVERGTGVRLWAWVDDCAVDPSEVRTAGSTIVQEEKTPFETVEHVYALLAEVPRDLCRRLAPNLSAACREAWLVRAGALGGGSLGFWGGYNVYGLFEAEGGGGAIVPLKNFRTEDAARSFLAASRGVKRR